MAFDYRLELWGNAVIMQLLKFDKGLEIIGLFTKEELANENGNRIICEQFRTNEEAILWFELMKEQAEAFKKELEVEKSKIKRFERLIGCDLFIENKIYNAVEIKGEFYCMSENKEILSNTKNKKYWSEIEVK